MTGADVSIESGGDSLSGRTAWARNLEAPLREFLRTQSAGATVLVAAIVIALAWANASSSYEHLWHTVLSVRIGSARVTQDLRQWLDNGLMTFFFFVVGLEARREFDLGELRDRRRLLLPVMAGVGGMALPVAIYLALNAAGAARSGWAAAMSTDTAFALGMLAIVGRRLPDSLRAFIVTVAVVDDLLSLLVIAVAFTSSVHVTALIVGLAILAVMVAATRLRVDNGPLYLLLGAGAWVALLRSGVDPVVVGLVTGLVTIAYPAARADLERASDLFRVFREQPTSELAQTARAGLRSAISPNERYQQLFHPVTSYVIVPLFALANAGFPISAGFLGRAYGSSLTLGIILGFVVGKPIGISAATWLGTRLSRGKVRPPVGWAAVIGGSAMAGIGFTVSLLIATLAFYGPALDEAKVGVLSTMIVAPAVSWGVVTVTRRLPRRLRVRALVGSSEAIVDLAVPVDPERDHIRGPQDARVTLLEYGDFECPFCGQAESVIRELLADFGELRYVWRHLPLNDVHPHAQIASEAAEAAGAQGRFWDMYDALLSRQGELSLRALMEESRKLGLDLEVFREHLRRRKGMPHIAEDVESADLSGVSGTPTFFINGHRHQGAYDIDTLTRAVKLAGARAALRA